MPVRPVLSRLTLTGAATAWLAAAWTTPAPAASAGTDVPLSNALALLAPDASLGPGVDGSLKVSWHEADRQKALTAVLAESHLVLRDGAAVPQTAAPPGPPAAAQVATGNPPSEPSQASAPAAHLADPPPAGSQPDCSRDRSQPLEFTVRPPDPAAVARGAPKLYVSQILAAWSRQAQWEHPAWLTKADFEITNAAEFRAPFPCAARDLLGYYETADPPLTTRIFLRNRVVCVTSTEDPEAVPCNND